MCKVDSSNERKFFYVFSCFSNLFNLINIIMVFVNFRFKLNENGICAVINWVEIKWRLMKERDNK